MVGVEAGRLTDLPPPRFRLQSTEPVRRPLIGADRSEWDLPDDRSGQASGPGPAGVGLHAHGRELRPAARLGGWLLMAAAAFAAPAVLDPIRLNSLTRALALAAALLGLQVLLGYGGLLSIGHGAMLGIGAWVTGVLMTDFGLRAELAIPAAGLALAAFGVLVGLPGLRLSGIGLALLTLAVAVSFPILHEKFVGPLGKVYDELVPPSWTGIGTDDGHVWSYALAALSIAALYLGLRLLLSGRFGRSLRAVRDEPIAAASFGIPVDRVRLAAFAVSAAAAGVGGALLVVRTPYVYGPDFPFQLSIQLFAVVLLVGADRLPGALAGALILTQLPRALGSFGLAGLADLAYALVLLVVILAFRGRGVGPWLHRRVLMGRLGRPIPIPTPR